MKAFILEGYGGPEKTRLVDIDEPKPGSNDLLIRVAAIGLNPVDFKIREGKLKLINSPALPITMGNELAGEVIECGIDVKQFKPGDQIIARVEKERLSAFAEYACIDESVAAHAPQSVLLKDAAALPLAGLTALQALRDELGAASGKHVLITGGAGGVGTFAIQLAKHLGATVTTTASPRGEELVRRMGADHVIDYTTTDLATVDTRFDGVFDLIGGDTLKTVFGLSKSGTTVVSVAGIPEPVTASKDLQRGFILRALFWFASFGFRRAAAKHDVRYRFLFMHASGSELGELADLVDAGKLEIVIDQRFPFEKIAEAFAYLESGRAKGKVIVDINP